MEKTVTKLAQRMAALGFTDKILSNHVGMERSMITKMRLGTASPSLRAAMKICDVVAGMRPEDMIVSHPKQKEEPK